MNLEFYRPLWGINKAIETYAKEAYDAGFTGLEGHLPDDKDDYHAFCQAIKKYQLSYIGEICTGGSQADAYWVPDRKASVDDHLTNFETELQRMQASELPIPFINCMGGLDAWPLTTALRFFEKAIQLAEKYKFLVSFETHRTRCLYAPWTTFDIIKEIPEITITADLSHWCVVAERLIDEEEGLSAIIPTTHHIHGRVGYDQGPQVPDPEAPEYAHFVKAHQRWWELIWASQYERGYTTTTMCTEYGPDGYLHHIPHSQQPVADLWEIMQWVYTTESTHFKQFKSDNNFDV